LPRAREKGPDGGHELGLGAALGLEAADQGFEAVLRRLELPGRRFVRRALLAEARHLRLARLLDLDDARLLLLLLGLDLLHLGEAAFGLGLVRDQLLARGRDRAHELLLFRGQAPQHVDAVGQIGQRLR